MGHGKRVDWWSLGCIIYEMMTGLPPFYTKDRKQLFNEIKNTELEIPKMFSPECKDLVQKLFIKDPTKRLGSNGAEEIMSHVWFTGVDWDAIEKKQVAPPFIPKLSSEYDTSYIDEDFTRKPAADSMQNSDNILNSVSSTEKWKGFTYKGGNELDDTPMDDQ